MGNTLSASGSIEEITSKQNCTDEMATGLWLQHHALTSSLGIVHETAGGPIMSIKSSAAAGSRFVLTHVLHSSMAVKDLRKQHKTLL